MDWADLVKSLAVLLVGAGISIGTTVAVDGLRARRERDESVAKRAVEIEEARRSEGAERTAEVYEALNIMSSYASETAVGDDRPPTTEREDRALDELRRLHPLMPDPAVREAVANGIYGISNLAIMGHYEWDLKEFGEDGYRELVDDMVSVVAAFIRRDSLPEDAIERLAAVAKELDRFDPNS